MADKFVSWLESAGAAVKKVTQEALGKILPIAAEAAEEAEPIVDLAFPMQGAMYNEVVGAVISTEQAYAASGQQNGTGTQKMQAVLNAVKSTLLPQAEKAGLTGDSATTAMTNYINGIVQLMNGPAIASAVNAVAATTK